MRIGIDTCGVGCIRFRKNRSSRIGRDGSGNLFCQVQGK